MLRTLRRSRDCSQKLLAERSGVSLRAIGALENGVRKAPYQATVRRLASALGLSPEEALKLESAARGARFRAGSAIDSHTALDPIVARIAGFVRSNRLVTLTGFSGAGTTYLARSAAKHVSAAYPGGLRFVDCATLADETAIAAALAEASLVRPVGANELLVILNICKTASRTAARAVDALLRSRPSITVLATGRCRLMLSSEVVHRVEMRHFADLTHRRSAELKRTRSRALPSDPAERALLRILSEFHDGLSHADLIAEFGDQVVFVLFRLVAQSLVSFTERETVVRYRILPAARSERRRRPDP